VFSLSRIDQEPVIGGLAGAARGVFSRHPRSALEVLTGGVWLPGLVPRCLEGAKLRHYVLLSGVHSWVIGGFTPCKQGRACQRFEYCRSSLTDASIR